MIDQKTRAKYRPTIGIECHVQLKTKTKLFSAVGNDARDHHRTDQQQRHHRHLLLEAAKEIAHAELDVTGHAHVGNGLVDLLRGVAQGDARRQVER